MFRPYLCATLLLATAGAAVCVADGGKVVISVERSTDANQPEVQPPFKGHRAAVDVAILLDTSNSMDGLISQAKSQLWTIVQQFSKAKKNGQTPMLRVALFEYGNTRLPAAEGFIRQVAPLSDDLDKLSEALFGLSTSGGDEYCGQVIDEALKRLDWSKDPNSYRAIFIAGNEPFTQGPIDYHTACKRAIERGIIVNTIHCGNNAEGINGHWQDGAKLAEGESFNIDQDRAVVQIKCPQDEIIIKLNAELNKTYLWFGDRKDRAYYAANQAAQDTNAQSAGEGVAATRVAAKASGAYSNQSRDLIDAMKIDADILKKVKEEQLPEQLRAMAPGQRQVQLSQIAAKRAEVQTRINALSAERDAYIAKEQQRLAKGPGNATLGDAVVSTIQKQLVKSGFENVPTGK